MKRFWHKFNHSLFKARSFHSNASKIAHIYEMARLTNSVSKFMLQKFYEIDLSLQYKTRAKFSTLQVAVFVLFSQA